MTRHLFPVLLCATLVFAGCSKPTADSLTTDYISKMKELVTVLKGVTDESSANAATDKVKSLVQDINKIQADMAALPKPTDDEAKKVMEAHEQEIMQVSGDFMHEAVRIGMNPKMAAPIDGALKEIKPPQ